MTTLRRLFGLNRAQPKRNADFENYYFGLLREGSGYPTADEARRDLRNREQMVFPISLAR